MVAACSREPVMRSDSCKSPQDFAKAFKRAIAHMPRLETLDFSGAQSLTRYSYTQIVCRAKDITFLLRIEIGMLSVLH